MTVSLVVVQVGVLAPEPTPTGQLHTGQVGQPFPVLLHIKIEAASSCVHGTKPPIYVHILSLCLLCSSVASQTCRFVVANFTLTFTISLHPSDDIP